MSNGGKSDTLKCCSAKKKKKKTHCRCFIYLGGLIDVKTRQKRVSPLMQANSQPVEVAHPLVTVTGLTENLRGMDDLSSRKCVRVFVFVCVHCREEEDDNFSTQWNEDSPCLACVHVNLRLLIKSRLQLFKTTATQHPDTSHS